MDDVKAPVVIGVSGRKRSGKDEVYKAIKAKYGDLTTAKVAFADPLKDEAAHFLEDFHSSDWVERFSEISKVPLAACFNIFNPIFEFHTLKVISPSTYRELFDDDRYKGYFRLLLQYWGTEYRRNQDDEYWLKAWAAKVQTLPEYVEVVVVPDVRFPNEYDFLLHTGATLLRVERPSLGTGADLHISETALDGDERYWDGVIVNDGTLEELANKVNDVLFVCGND